MGLEGVSTGCCNPRGGDGGLIYSASNSEVVLELDGGWSVECWVYFDEERWMPCTQGWVNGEGWVDPDA